MRRRDDRPLLKPAVVTRSSPFLSVGAGGPAACFDASQDRTTQVRTTQVRITQARIDQFRTTQVRP